MALRNVEMQWEMQSPGDLPSNVRHGGASNDLDDLLESVSDELKAHGLEIVTASFGYDDGIFFTIVKLGEEPVLMAEPTDERPYWWRNAPDGPEAKCDDDAALLAYAQDGQWVNQQNFEQCTGVTFAELKGKWFSVVHGRVDISDKQ